MSAPPAEPEPGGAGTGAPSGGLTHIDEHGRARMVDVTAKPLTQRVALAKCVVVTSADATTVLDAAADGLDAVEGARFAGIQAAKQTSTLIPLCHPIRLDRVTVDVAVGRHRIEISAITEIVERTGVEMEALTACAFAALTVVTSLMPVDPGASIEELTLWHKSGGRSGNWQRSGPEGRLTRNPAEAAAAGAAAADAAAAEAGPGGSTF